MSEIHHPNVNGLRIVADFDHMAGHRDKREPEIDRIFGELLEVVSALECVVVLLAELECQQIRADYLKCLLEPHVERAGRAADALGALI